MPPRKIKPPPRPANPARLDSVAELCNAIWGLEKDFDLLDWNIGGVSLWQSSRMYIYYRLAMECGLYAHPHAVNRGVKSLLKEAWSLLLGLTVENPFLRRGKADIGVVDHPRSKELQGRTVDIYSWFLCRELMESGQQVMCFERPFLGSYQKRHELPRIPIGIIESVALVLARLFPARIEKEKTAFITELEREIAQRIGIQPNLHKLLSTQLRRFRVRVQLYERLLERFPVRELYVVVAYFMAPLIDVCRRRGIPVYEIQHGVISKYHLGYSFPGRSPGSLRYFPDYMLAWGDGWPGTKNLPLAPDRCIKHGFRYFEVSTAGYRRGQQAADRVLIISQSVHGNALAKFLREHLDQLQGLRITYKLHPSEFNRRAEYSDLSYLEEHLENFEVLEKGDVYALLSQCRAVVGVFSTVLFEALAFNCDVYVCPLYGWEYMEELLEEGRIWPFRAFPKPAQAM